MAPPVQAATITMNLKPIVAANPANEFAPISFNRSVDFPGGAASPACGLSLGQTNGVGASVGVAVDMMAKD